MYTRRTWATSRTANYPRINQSTPIGARPHFKGPAGMICSMLKTVLKPWEVFGASYLICSGPMRKLRGTLSWIIRNSHWHWYGHVPAACKISNKPCQTHRCSSHSRVTETIFYILLEWKSLNAPFWQAQAVLSDDQVIAIIVRYPS